MDDPRKNEIPIEIKSLEEKSRKRQNEIEDLHATLQELRLNSEAQNELSLLQDQVKKDIEGLAEAFKEQSYELSGGGFTAPKLPAEGDDLGEQLLDVVTQLSNEVRAKFESTNLKFTNFTDDIAGKERTKSQQDGLLNRDKRTLGALQNKAKTLEGEDGEVSRYRRIVKCLRQFENSNDRTPDFSDDNPQEILAYIEDRLDKEKSSDPLSLEVVGPVLKKLGSMVSMWFVLSTKLCSARADFLLRF